MVVRKRLHSTWERMVGVLSANNTYTDPYLVIRLKTVFVLSIVAILALSLFGAFNFYLNNILVAMYQLVSAVILVINLWYFTHRGDVGLAANTILLLYLPMTIYLLYTGGIGGAGVVWLFLIPPAAYFLAGIKWGNAWMVIVAASLAVIAYMQIAQVVGTYYELAFLTQASICLAIASVIVYYHEKVSQSAQRMAEQRNREEAELNLKLAQSNQGAEEARMRYQALMESIGDGIIATDKTGKVILVNQAALNLLKIESIEIMGKTVDVFRAEDAKGNKISYQNRIISQVLKTNKKITTDISSQYYYVDSTGRRYPVASTQTPIIIGGENQGAVLVFRDMTEEKQLDEAKTELISLASHQLNTPLTAINWYAEMLLSGESGKLTNEQRQYLEEISVSGAKMADIISDFLNASRIEMGTFVPQYNELNVTDAANEVLSELEPSIGRKKLHIVKKFGTFGAIKADKRLIQIILQNLLSNSVKYTPEKGSITLEIAKTGSSLMISIADTGMGIPKSEQPHIFTKMYRAQNAEKMAGEGTGLGLYIVKSSVEQLHGTIKMKSAEGKGTTFNVQIPLNRKHEPKPAGALHKRGV